MNTKKAYRGKGQPEFLYEVTVNGRRLAKGMQASLLRGIGYPAGRYEFRYGEVNAAGELTLQFYGPIRRVKQKFRVVTAEAVRTVHIRSRGNVEEQDEEE